jgi:hypothetical protein
MVIEPNRLRIIIPSRINEGKLKIEIVITLLLPAKVSLAADILFCVMKFISI